MSRALRHLVVLAYAVILATGCKLLKRRIDAGSASVILSETYRGKGSLVTFHYPPDFAAKLIPITSAAAAGSAIVSIMRTRPDGSDEGVLISSITRPISIDVQEFARIVHKGTVESYPASMKYAAKKRTDDVPFAGTTATCFDGTFTPDAFSHYEVRSCHFILDGHGFSVSKHFAKAHADDEALLDRILDAVEYHDSDPDAVNAAAAELRAPLGQTRTSKKRTFQLHFPDAFAYTPVGDTFGRVTRSIPDEGLVIGLFDDPISQDRREIARVVEAAEKRNFAEVKVVKNDPKDTWEGTPAVHVETEAQVDKNGAWYSRHAWYMVRERRGCVVTFLYPKSQPEEFKLLDRIARATVFAKPGKTLVRSVDEPENP